MSRTKRDQAKALIGTVLLGAKNPVDIEQPYLPKGMKISQEVEYVSVEEIRENPLNKVFFKEEGESYFKNLTADIEERGIVVPLMAKRDGTLLSGHNRLTAAKKLGLKKVPVQFVEEELSEQAEKEFLIKDNLYRRQFSTKEWIEVYRRLYPDFDKTILQETRGGGKKRSKSEQSLLFESEEKAQKKAGSKIGDGEKKRSKSEQSLLFENERLTSEKIARDTGQKPATVRKQLASLRKELKGERESVPSPKIQQKTNTTALKQASKSLQTIVRTMKKENEETLRRFVNILNKTIADLQ